MRPAHYALHHPTIGFAYGLTGLFKWAIGYPLIGIYLAFKWSVVLTVWMFVGLWKLNVLMYLAIAAGVRTVINHEQRNRP